MAYSLPWNRTALSLIFFAVFWTGLGLWNGDSQVLPLPWELPFGREMGSGELWYHLGQTLWRVVVAFIFAMVIGTGLGIIMGLFPNVNGWLDPWLVIFLNLPALVLIVLCYLWIGLNEMAAIIAVVLNKIPNITAMIREGARALDKSLDEMAKVFRVPPSRYLTKIVIPQLAPFIAGASRSGIAIIWKIVLVVEFLGRSNGVGFQIHLYFQLFDVGAVLVYSLSFIAVMLIIEWGLLQPLEKQANRWRNQ